MADLPNPQSFEQLLADMLSAYASKQGVDDFNVGSAVTSFFEVVALTTARASGDVFQILRDFSVDRATGDALKRLATENNVNPVAAKVSTGRVSVLDTSFNKISTKIYSGANPPNIGSTQIKVSDASLFTASGSLYIGRGTPNVEGPLPYTSITPTGGYYVITLSNPTTKFHNLGEAVIMAQGGNRAISANAIVLSPSVGSSSDIQFSVTAPGVILDGEVLVDNIPVSALTPGSSGNVPRGAIKEFASAPFSGATVTNPLPFTTGQDSETDEQLRVRIKRSIASKGLGTATAVKSALIGATPSDENATIVSDSLIINTDGSATVFIDDGSGYEARTAGVGLENIVDIALGGEQFFQLQTGGRQAPVAKAFLESTFSAPFDVIGGDTLAVIVGGQTYQHVFDDTDFRSIGGATAFEITASINANTTLGFEATTSEGGQYVVIRSKTEGNDSMKIAVPTTDGRDAAHLLGFPSNQTETLRLYKNNFPLSKDGNTASIFTQSQSLWSSTIQNGDTLILIIDGTDAITFTIADADFIATGLYTNVSATNSLDSWALVLNAKLTGVTVEVVGTQLELVSNLGASNRASLTVDESSTLVAKGMFSTAVGLTSQGKASDFELDRNTAQFTLVTPLIAGDKLSAGSEETEARVESSEIPGGSIVFSADGHVWLLVDAPGTLIPTGVAGNTLITTSKPATNTVRYTSSAANAFVNVQVGDYLIIWSQELASANRLEGRVHAKTGTTIDILVTSAEYAAASAQLNILFSDGFVVLRSKYAPQKFRVQAGTKTLDQVADELQAQTDGLIFSVLSEQYIIVRSVTKDTSGSLLVVTADPQGKFIGLPIASSDQSKDSLIAFYDSEEYDAKLPLFVHALVATGTAANPIDSFISNFVSSISFAGRDPNELIDFLQPYGGIDDNQAYGENVQVESYVTTAINVTENPKVRRLRQNDRFYIANPLDFGYNDTAVVVLDNDTSNKSFEIPFYRRAITNTGVISNPSTFNAYDVDSGSAANFSSAFGATFDFSNFKVMMQAKKVLKPTPPKTAILYRSVRWGRSGEKINVGYVYPSQPNSEISAVVVVDTSTNIAIGLKSGPAVPSSIDGTTEWNVSVTPNTPSAGIDQVTYTWSGTGTNPALGLSGGEYVGLTDQSELNEANIGIFRVSTQGGFTPTATSFTVQRPTGSAVSESNKATLVPGAIYFYDSEPTLAADVYAFVNANLFNYVTATLVNDGGTDGSGFIVLSTYEDSGFTYQSQYLQDGINWIASSNLAGSPNFSFKVPLDLPTDVGYAFNNTEEVRLIPTTVAQVAALISVLAVTGFTTIGTVAVVERSQKLELASQILGSEGAIQIIGGLANGFEVPVLDSATRLDNVSALVSVDKVSAQGIHSDQWFRLQASLAQSKDALLSSNTSINVVSNSPATGQSTINLTGRTLTQRYFGKPRHHVRTRGNTFKVEKQGSLVCISWNGVGTSPAFAKVSLNLDDASGGTLNVSKVTGTNDALYIILTGATNFTELSIGDLVTVSGLAAGNNGTFLVTGVSDNGTQIRVLNPEAVDQLSSGTFTFTGNSTAGDAFTVGGNTLIAGTDFAIGASQTDTAQNLAAVIGTLPSVVAVANGSVVTVRAQTPSQSTTLSYSGTAVVVASNATLVGTTFNSSTFTASSEVAEGDSVILSSPFAVLNQGTFRVIRRYNDSIWIENVNVVEEEIVLPYNAVSLGFDATTSFKVNATANSINLGWNGVGTEPTLGNAKIGDVVTFGTDFAAANRGSYMVLNAGAKLPEITQFIIPTGTQFTVGGAGTYFKIYNAGDVNKYYVWLNVNASNSDPAPGGGFTGIAVAILSGDTAAQVAVKVANAITANASGITATNFDNTVTTTTSGSIETTHATNFNVPAPFQVTVTQPGRRSYLECVNPSAANEAAVFVTTNVLECHRPQMKFWEYEASIPGDIFVATGDILTTINAGNHVIVEVLNRDSAVVAGTMAAVGLASLNGRETSVFIQEGIPYYGYKQIASTAVQPGAPTRTILTLTTNAQYEKINESASVSMSSLGKMDFDTVIRKGLDSYRYNTGLIAEANRIIYGDPRDPATYPGVGAAGAEIFVREPLTRRIQVSIDVRIITGVPFAQTAEQVRTSVSSLVNSNDVGNSIAISDIVSAVNAIPGVRAVAISSPQYDETHDIIFIAPSEKARIIDPTLDISVNQIGS